MVNLCALFCNIITETIWYFCSLENKIWFSLNTAILPQKIHTNASSINYTNRKHILNIHQIFILHLNITQFLFYSSELLFRKYSEQVLLYFFVIFMFCHVFCIRALRKETETELWIKHIGLYKCFSLMELIRDAWIERRERDYLEEMIPTILVNNNNNKTKTVMSKENTI